MLKKTKFTQKRKGQIKLAQIVNSFKKSKSTKKKYKKM